VSINLEDNIFIFTKNAVNLFLMIIIIKKW